MTCDIIDYPERKKICPKIPANVLHFASTFAVFKRVASPSAFQQYADSWIISNREFTLLF